jgi:hypothetical protein
MKPFIAPAVVLAIVLVFVSSRSVLVTAQQPDAAAPPAVSQPAVQHPSVTPPGDFGFPVQQPPSPIVGPKNPAAVSLTDLVQQLKEVRRRKAELQQEEAKITTVIRQRIEEEKKLHQEVLRLIGAPDGQEPKADDIPRPEINVDRNNGLPKQRGEQRVPDGLPK